MKNIKRSYIFIFILILIFFISFGASYSILMNKSEHHGKLNIVAGDLNYKIESHDLVDNKITVEAGIVKKITLTLTSLNEVNSKYELYYTLGTANSNVIVGYGADTQDNVSGTINADETKTITLIIDNNSNSSTTVTFGVAGGLMNNVLVLNEGNNLDKIIATKSLAQDILDSNDLIDALPTLTDSSNNTTDASGLYKSVATNDGSPTYYFRGNVENNYVKFAGFIWRIVRINEDGTIRIVMQDGIYTNGYNATSSSKENMYYTNSSSKTKLETWYQTNIIEKGYSNNIVTGQYFCEQAKVALSSDYITSSGANMILYSDYKSPNFRCEDDLNGYGVVEANIGLLTSDEVIHAGGYYNSSNSNYYLYNDSIHWWTMSPGGFSGTSAFVWYMSSAGSFGPSYVANTSRRLRAVLNLKVDIVVTGSGTSGDMYRVIN